MDYLSKTFLSFMALVLACLLVLAIVKVVEYYNLPEDKKPNKKIFRSIDEIYNEVESYLPDLDALKPYEKTYYQQCLDIIKSQCDEAGIIQYYPLVAAISRLETGNFTSKLFLNGNNWGGMKYAGKFKKFESKTEGLHKYIWMMKSKFISKYGDDVEAMQKRYCPNSDTWAPKVRRIMAEIEDKEWKYNLLAEYVLGYRK